MIGDTATDLISHYPSRRFPRALLHAVGLRMGEVALGIVVSFFPVAESCAVAVLVWQESGAVFSSVSRSNGVLSFRSESRPQVQLFGSFPEFFVPRRSQFLERRRLVSQALPEIGVYL